MPETRSTTSSFPATPENRPSPNPIRTGELYCLADAKARLGWSDSAFRSAKSQGLKLLACGKRRYITGDEVLRFLESIQETK